jgi:hypothetical protein
MGTFVCQRRLQRAFQIYKAVNNLGSPKVPQLQAMPVCLRCYVMHSLPFSSIVAPFVASIIQHEVMLRVFQGSLGICKQRKQQRYAVMKSKPRTPTLRMINRGQQIPTYSTLEIMPRSSHSASSSQDSSSSTSSRSSLEHRLDSGCPNPVVGYRSSLRTSTWFRCCPCRREPFRPRTSAGRCPRRQGKTVCVCRGLRVS